MNCNDLPCRCKPLHEYLGIGLTMRASCYFYNTASDIQLFLMRLKEAIPQARPIAEKVGMVHRVLHAMVPV